MMLVLQIRIKQLRLQNNLNLKTMLSPQKFFIPSSVVEIPLNDDFFLIKNLYSSKEYLIINSLVKKLAQDIILNKKNIDKVSKKEIEIIHNLEDNHILFKNGETLKLEFHQ